MATWPRGPWEQLPNKPLGKWGKEQLWRERESVHHSFGPESLHPSAPSPAQPWPGPLGPTQDLLFAMKQGHKSLTQAAVSVVSRLMESGVLRGCFPVGVLRLRVCSRITGSLFGSPQSLRRTADPVYWAPFMDEETETGEFNALVYQWGYGHLFRRWRGFPSNSLGISGSTCRESPPTSFLCPAAGHPPG